MFTGISLLCLALSIAYLAWRDPLTPWLRAREDAKADALELDACRRKDEREAFLTAINATTAISVKAMEASTANASVLSSFMDGFKVTGAPKSRVLDEQADYVKYLKDHGYAVPPEFEKLDALGQMKFILDDDFSAT